MASPASAYATADKLHPFYKWLEFDNLGTSYTLEPDNVLQFSASSYFAVRETSGYPVKNTDEAVSLQVGPDEFSLGSFYSVSTSIVHDLGADHYHYVYTSAPSSTNTAPTSGTAWKAAVPYSFSSSYSPPVTLGYNYYVFDLAPSAPAFFDYCRNALIAGQSTVDLVAQIKTVTTAGSVFYSSIVPLVLTLPVIREKTLL